MSPLVESPLLQCCGRSQDVAMLETFIVSGMFKSLPKQNRSTF